MSIQSIQVEELPGGDVVEVGDCFAGFEGDPAGEGMLEEEFEDLLAEASPGGEINTFAEDDAGPGLDSGVSDFMEGRGHSPGSVWSSRLDDYDLSPRSRHGLGREDREDPNSRVTGFFFDDEPGDELEAEECKTAGEKWRERIGYIDKYLPVIYCAYGLQPRHVPPCWKQHPPLVMLLSALVHCWSESFLRPGAAGSTEFNALTRIKQVVAELELQNTGKSCVTGEHQPWPVSNWIVNQLPDNMRHFHPNPDSGNNS